MGRLLRAATEWALQAFAMVLMLPAAAVAEGNARACPAPGTSLCKCVALAELSAKPAILLLNPEGVHTD